MNFFRSNRILNPLLVLLALAIVTILVAVTIQFLSGAFQFIESLLQVTSREGSRLVSAIAR